MKYYVLLVVATLVAWGCGGNGGTTAPPPPPPTPVPTSIQLSATSLDLRVGETRQLTATVKDQTGATISSLPTGFAITWSSSDTTRVVVEATGLARGVRPGTATITARGGVLSAAAAATVRGDVLQGNAGAPAATAIPLKEFVPRAEDYSATHPELAGKFLSFTTILLILKPQTTIGEANALIEPLLTQIVGGIPGTVSEPGILFLQLPTTSHQQLEQALATLRQNPHVQRVVQDMLLETDAITVSGPGVLPAPWTWELTPSGGNWGLERIRVPQMWNLNAAIRKAGAPVPLMGILDAGFDLNHQDLAFEQNLSPNALHYHGAHVAGIIGATFNNGVGIDGLNPFAKLVVLGPAFTSVIGITEVLVRVSHGQTMISGYYTLVRSRPNIRVVNTSLGYNWYTATPPIDSDVSQAAQLVAAAQGDLFNQTQRLLALLGPLPVLVTAAGNETGKNARFASPMANAALGYGNKNIIVVESVADAPGAAGGASLSSFSNINGHLSAPGSNILSTIRTYTDANGVHPGPYGVLSGTSMAAPHVAGLMGFLYTLDPSLPAPTLTDNRLSDLLTSSSMAVGGGAKPRIDAFAAVMSVDGVNGNNRILKMLVDVDDGSRDGNRRLDDTGAPDLDEDHDLDGGPGDGQIDMRDFRRWRDWLLQSETPAGLALNGAAAHPKKDLNGDGLVGTPVQENVYPRGDFNGDGRIDRALTATVPGFASPVTDLQILQKLFSDPDYQVGDLPNLISSGDLLVDASQCLLVAGALRVATSIRIRGTIAPVQTRTHTVAVPPFVYTAAVADYTARAEVLDGANTVLGIDETDFSLAPGSDTVWKPTCAPGGGTVRITAISGYTLARAQTPASAGVPLCEKRVNLPATNPLTVSYSFAAQTCTLSGQGAFAPITATATTQGQFSTATAGGLVTSVTATFSSSGSVTGNLPNNAAFNWRPEGITDLTIDVVVEGGPVTYTITGQLSTLLSSLPFAGASAGVEILAIPSGSQLRWTASLPNGPASVPVNGTGVLQPGRYRLDFDTYLGVVPWTNGDPTGSTSLTITLSFQTP